MRNKWPDLRVLFVPPHPVSIGPTSTIYGHIGDGRLQEAVGKGEKDLEHLDQESMYDGSGRTVHRCIASA